MVNSQDSQQDADSFISGQEQQRSHVVYAKQTRQRQIFMEDLREYRTRLEKEAMRKMRKLVGPRWYHVLSVPQRQALDRLEKSVYQDLLEDRPTRTSRIMHKLGIFPPVNGLDLMSANFHGSEDPKQMLAHLFFLLHGHSIEGKRNWYDLNSKLLLSAIYYLGLKNLIELLREKLKPDRDLPPTPPTPKAKPQPPLASPYLKKTIIPVWYPASPKKFKPAPLPNLDKINEPYVESDEARIKLKPPPPPPPPPPPKRVPLSLCDKLAGVRYKYHIAPNTITVAKQTMTTHRTKTRTKRTIEVKKKTYGICIPRPPPKGSLRRKLKPPSTGIPNAQYLIQGVLKVAGRTVFVVGSVSITPANGELIHGGFAVGETGYLNIHLGYRAFPAAPPPDACDCVEKFHDKVFDWVKERKCKCRHYYDYGNEGTFPPEEPPYFQKPTAVSPYQFNYDTIYDTDPKQVFVKRELIKILDADSVIGTKKELVIKKRKEKDNIKKKSSKTCLGPNPKPSDYLKCTLRLLRQANIAAKLPDVHLAPELVEWMRRRIYGPFRPHQRQAYLHKTQELQATLDCLAPRMCGPLLTRNNTSFRGASTWIYKEAYREKFNKFSDEYRRKVFRKFAYINNLFWRIMFQAEFPDKNFREIFFSYLYATAEDLMLMHPYSTTEVNHRKLQLMQRRVVCLPDGYEPDELPSRKLKGV